MTLPKRFLKKIKTKTKNKTIYAKTGKDRRRVGRAESKAALGLERVPENAGEKKKERKKERKKKKKSRERERETPKEPKMADLAKMAAASAKLLTSTSGSSARRTATGGWGVGVGEGGGWSALSAMASQVVLMDVFIGAGLSLWKADGIKSVIGRAPGRRGGAAAGGDQ